MAEKWVTNMFVLNVIAIAQFCFLGDIYTIPRDAAYLIYTGNQKKKSRDQHSQLQELQINSWLLLC